jgi:copper chaperone
MLLLKVSGMDCQHCVETVTEAVSKLPGAGEVKVDLASGEVRVAGDVAREAAAKAIEAKGYEVVG